MSTPTLGGLPLELRQFSPLSPKPPQNPQTQVQQASAPLQGRKVEGAAGVADKAAVGPVSLSELQHALQEVREVIKPVAQNLLFSIDEDTGKTVVKVVDTATDEVIRQIPSEEIISIAKALDKLQGLLLHQQA